MAGQLNNWKAKVALRSLQEGQGIDDGKEEEGQGIDDGEEEEGFHMEMFSLRFALHKQQRKTLELLELFGVQNHMIKLRT